ncbi:hypothetical protein C5167_025692 [Papaver somniferum]|uniref:Uncharacterized protein n=1 Tax=Papaver somniferum TaxID=3469 RepID=A0A4Y7JTS5_PAPSO|nr:hypothetical protein C5167_025692 [Papaver somniferum]
MNELIKTYPVFDPENFVELETREMLKLMVGCCKALHIWKLTWESARVNEKATKLCQGVAAVNKFEDEAYNRVGYTIFLILLQMQSRNLVPFENL